ncbi:MAG: hypothetical protein A2506_13280 [Elusimicrobia bacterium RIFOXYD12_FULL_66_9]|nr:MAG: hypothetical protein A2506_13280 [Elusimicrobia bacterium RIFOXYD12_FULL_66_9]
MPASTAHPGWRDNLAELKTPLSREEARVESSRCLYCHDAPCVTSCPTHIDVPRFIRQLAGVDPLGAGQTILEANPLGHSCARVCPVEVLCEGACVYKEWNDDPIAIARLQRHATDAVHAANALPFGPGPDNGMSVAVVGAGPAGVTAATYLRRLGFAVTIYEKRSLPGGLNTFGVAEYKMDRRTSLEEMRLLFRLGCSVVTGREVGKDVSAAKLLKDFDAVFLGVGLARTRSLSIPGEGLPGVVDALSFIERVKARKAHGGGRVVVIGGGNTAIDAATQSVRTGAEGVTLAYRRGRKDMPAYDFEVALARTDGVSLLMNARPERILGNGKVTGVVFARTKGGGLFTLECDRVIKAIGQDKERTLPQTFGVRLNDDGTIAVDSDSMRTSRRHVFAGGDAVNGGKEVVNAAAHGKRAAWGIHRALRPKAAPPEGNAYWIKTL